MRSLDVENLIIMDSIWIDFPMNKNFLTGWFTMVGTTISTEPVLIRKSICSNRGKCADSDKPKLKLLIVDWLSYTNEYKVFELDTRQFAMVHYLQFEMDYHDGFIRTVI